MRIIPFLAFKDMVRDRKIVILVVCLLAFSYINLTFFPAFLNGLSDTFQNDIVETETSHIIISPSVDSNKPYIDFESSTRKKINLIPGVVGSSSEIGTSGTVIYQGKEIGVRVLALQPSEDREVTTIQDKVLKGDFLSDSDSDSLVMGEFIAGRKIEDLIGQENVFGFSFEGLGGADVGEKVTIRFTNGIEREYKIKGITGSLGFSSVGQTVYMTRDEVEDVLGIEDKASSILVRLNDKRQADYYKKLILDLGLPTAKIQTWAEASTFTEGINQTFGVVILVTTMVGIIIVMATIGIVIFINTSRKKRIIGVLKAVGMQKNQLMLVFLFQSLLFGIIGTAIGVAVVYSFVFYLTINPIPLAIGNLKPVLLPETTINSAIILIASSIIAGYLPARMAAKHDILESIKEVE